MKAIYTSGTPITWAHNPEQGEHTEGLVIDYDEDEEKYHVLHLDETGAWMTNWIEAESISPNQRDEPLRFPGSSVTAENLFVVLHETTLSEPPVIELYTSPQAMESAFPNVEDLRVKIMEAVADPGENIDLGGGSHLSFRFPQGETA